MASWGVWAVGVGDAVRVLVGEAVTLGVTLKVRVALWLAVDDADKVGDMLGLGDTVLLGLRVAVKLGLTLAVALEVGVDE